MGDEAVSTDNISTNQTGSHNETDAVQQSIQSDMKSPDTSIKSNKHLSNPDILNLLNQKIDAIENQSTNMSNAAVSNTDISNTNGTSKHSDESDQCNSYELELVRTKHRDILSSISTIEKIDNKIQYCMSCFTQEYERRLVCERQLQYYKTVNIKLNKQRDRLESLCML